MIANTNSKGRPLVIGASGQVGSQFMRILEPAHAIGTSRHPQTSAELYLDLSLLAGQYPDAKRLLQETPASVVYCLGGYTDVESCESDEDMAKLVNCEGPATLAEAAADYGIPFVFFSSEYVFNGKSGPYTEDAAPDPISAYGRTKFLGELAVAKSHPQALIIRTTVVYGPDNGAKNFLYGLRRALRSGQPFQVASDQFSTPTYNVDLVKAVVSLVVAGKTGIVHVSGPERLSRLDFALQAARLMGFETERIIGAPTALLGQRAPRPLHGGLQTDKLRQTCPGVQMRKTDECIRHWLATAGFEDEKI